MSFSRSILLLFLCCGYAVASAPADEIRKILSASSIRGAAISIIQTSAEPELINYGDDGHIPVSASTRFRAGSISKLVTSCLVLRMEQAGYLKITDPVNQLWPGLMEDPTTRVEHLLEHTSGLAGSSYAEYAEQSPGASPRKYVEQKRPFPTNWRPGTHFSYANDGHTIAAAIIEKLSSTDFDTLIRREVFQPLGMEDSTFRQDGPLSLSYQANGTSEIGRWEMPFRPSGALVTTAGDLAKLMRMLLAEGALPDGSVFLPQAAIQRMHHAETSLAAAHGIQEGAYGLGNFTFVAAGHPFRGHWGRTEGFQSIFGYLPGNGSGFALLVNTDDRQTVFQLREAIAAHLTQDLPPAGAPATSLHAPPFPVEGIYTNASQVMPMRQWLFALSNAKRIRLHGNELMISSLLPGAATTRWKTTSSNRYQAESLPIPTGTFSIESGKIFWIDGESYVRESPWHVYPRIILLGCGLTAAFAGALIAAGRFIPGLSRRISASPALRLAGISGIMFTLMAILFFHYGLGGPDEAAILGKAGVESFVLLLASILAPLAALAAMALGLRHGKRRTLFLSVPLVLLGMFLAVNGWCPLITFA